MVIYFKHTIIVSYSKTRNMPPPGLWEMTTHLNLSLGTSIKKIYSIPPSPL